MLWTSYWKSICFVQIIRKIAYSYKYIRVYFLIFILDLNIKWELIEVL
jgi:hypothetical protein